MAEHQRLVFIHVLITVLDFVRGIHILDFNIIKLVSARKDYRSTDVALTLIADFLSERVGADMGKSLNGRLNLSKIRLDHANSWRRASLYNNISYRPAQMMNASLSSSLP